MFSHLKRNYISHFTLLFVICISPYLGTSNYSWHLDDPPNILHNNALHITNLYPSSLINTFFAYPGEPGKFFRPVANLSFALNWYFGQNRTFGYHIVNIAIHLLTTIALYLSTLLLLQSPALKNRPYNHPASIALLAASLWAIAPVHTQTVTYIVQRMAQLATLFSITAILFFLLARLTTNKKKIPLFSICFLCCSLLALGSKENSILLLPSILLIELIFFYKRKSILIVLIKNKKISLPLLLITTTGVGLFAYYYGADFTNYDHRSFTIQERLLTEPRILLFYLSQIFFPLTSRLSIEHDIILSNSIFSPWTTLPSLLTCTGLIIFSCCQMRKHPLLSFAILYFFLNQLVESTFIPLELLFEHRNYLPSLFLFLPIATFIVGPVRETSSKDKWKKTLLIATCTGFMIISGYATYERNKSWANDQSLWKDAVAKAPKSGRAKLNLATTYIEQNRHQEALLLCKQAEQLTGATKNKLVPISLNLKGVIAYKEGNLDKAATYFKQAFSLRSDYTEVTYKLIFLLIEMTRYEEALAMVKKRYKLKNEPELLLIKASLLLRINKPTESLKAYQTARPFFPSSTLIAAGQGKAMSVLGHYKKADTILNWAVKNNEPGSFLLRIENSLRANDNNQANNMLQQLLQSVPFNKLLSDINAPQTGASQVPFSNTLLHHALLKTAGKITSPPHQ